jgi:hypothetical protein
VRCLKHKVRISLDKCTGGIVTPLARVFVWACLSLGSIVGLKLLPLPIDGAYTKMALVTYSSVEEATTALINVHNHLLGDKHLRVSFSRTSVSDAAAARPAAG